MMFHQKTHAERNAHLSKRKVQNAISFVLCTIFAMTVLTGCGDNSNSNSSIQTSEITTTISTTQTTAISATESIVTSETTQSADIIAAEDAARAYYENTVFQVQSMEVSFSNDTIVKFTVYATKDGKECEPRTIEMQKKDGIWEKFSEGY